MRGIVRFKVKVIPGFLVPRTIVSIGIDVVGIFVRFGDSVRPRMTVARWAVEARPIVEVVMVLVAVAAHTPGVGHQDSRRAVETIFDVVADDPE